MQRAFRPFTLLQFVAALNPEAAEKAQTAASPAESAMPAVLVDES